MEQTDIAVLSLLETGQRNNLKFNPNKIQFKTKGCQFFGQPLTPEGMRIDLKKISAFRKMDALQSNKKELVSFQGMVN